MRILCWGQYLGLGSRYRHVIYATGGGVLILLAFAILFFLDWVWSHSDYQLILRSSIPHPKNVFIPGLLSALYALHDDYLLC